MCTVRYIDRFLPDDPLDAPWPVDEHLAAQLGIEDASVVKRYTERPKTAYEHAWEIRDAYEYREYEDAEWSRRFRTFVHGRAWTHAEGPVALFNQAVGWLRRHRVLLPGVSVLARQVSEVLDMPGKIADFLRATDLDPAERATLVQGVTVRRGQGYTLRITAAPAVHRQLLDGTAAVPAQRKARREYENRVNALPTAGLR
ncbi:hypothetical protein SNA_21235 [Streptomyces natalensis ATCC 27448]|uniref:DUF4158 domain-containing protein n=1 Tax=Streptomyces natalensis ATCC 27448 TaxID=1240678 RepID=A0A0D7CIZ7_9ACTN|nr:hypothetical protein SNA_21235 [Streptomyces natalensis ATCC 27448]